MLKIEILALLWNKGMTSWARVASQKRWALKLPLMTSILVVNDKHGQWLANPSPETIWSKYTTFSKAFISPTVDAHPAITALDVVRLNRSPADVYEQFNHCYGYYEARVLAAVRMAVWNRLRKWVFLKKWSWLCDFRSARLELPTCHAASSVDKPAASMPIAR